MKAKECNEKIQELTAKINELENSNRYLRDQVSRENQRANDYRKDAAVMEERLRNHDGRTDERIFYLMAENSRLWYLVRALSKDETLKENPANHEYPPDQMPPFRNAPMSPFHKPNF